MRPTSLEWVLFALCLVVIAVPHLLGLALRVAVWVRARRERRG